MLICLLVSAGSTAQLLLSLTHCTVAPGTELLYWAGETLLIGFLLAVVGLQSYLLRRTLSTIIKSHLHVLAVLGWFRDVYNTCPLLELGYLLV